MKIGLEQLRDSPDIANEWGRCGLLCNQASVTRDFKASWDIVKSALGDRLTCFFGPQHGFHATVQDNMIETGHVRALRFTSTLYSETRERLRKC